MGRFSRLRKNKKFDYNPRYYDKGEGNPFKIERKLDKFRTTYNTSGGIKGKFRRAMEDRRRRGDPNLRLRMLIIIAILVLIFLFIIDFDLSIFF
ncbi:riboflavin synthase subunit beta [Lentiprolixibacter aurantiacus]|uniref:Riboflavin synthase subunit beta n=1 Tax=Lentiprolixibacter aurantiacus TaxID=2993939 RepID=A0AAE3MMG0_9FLAO|nr:riboflavin synthase subunit beta [Lentiprolixibacter aurantiacus]MCX2720416.1 riboflavin synthase subunit beta [Lentiprolixibacter aurantiacus]